MPRGSCWELEVFLEEKDTPVVHCIIYPIPFVSQKRFTSRRLVAQGTVREILQDCLVQGSRRTPPHQGHRSQLTRGAPGAGKGLRGWTLSHGAPPTAPLPRHGEPTFTMHHRICISLSPVPGSQVPWLHPGRGPGEAALARAWPPNVNPSPSLQVLVARPATRLLHTLSASPSRATAPSPAGGAKGRASVCAHVGVREPCRIMLLMPSGAETELPCAGSQTRLFAPLNLLPSSCRGSVCAALWGAGARGHAP